MERNNSGVDLKKMWPFWGLHFGIHLIIGSLATIAGLVIILTMGEVISGLALVGAGSFAIVNGWQGLRELTTNNVNALEVNRKGDSW